MERTEMLCPECMKKRLLTANKVVAHCDGCGFVFIFTGKNRVKYANDEDLKGYDVDHY